MKFKVSKFVFAFLGVATLLVAFNNCGEGFIATKTGSSSSGFAFFSQAPGESCEDALLRVYKSTYHPFLAQTCSGCHINGPGIGTFANPDALASFNSFMSIGPMKISNQALNDAHKPPYTGSQNAPTIDILKTYWVPAQSSYASCVANSGGTLNQGSAVRTLNKPVPAGATTNNYARVEWDLETESTGKLPLIAGIDVRIAMISGVTRGYEFRNPTLRAKSVAAGNFEARALNLLVNSEMQSDITTFSNINYVVGGITDVNLSPGTANALAVYPVAAGTTIALEFTTLRSTTATSTGPTTPTPTPTPTPVGTRVTYGMLSGTGGVFANSCFNCHSGPAPKAGLNLADYASAKAAAQNIRTRVTNPANPMPVGGLLPQAQQDMITSWVDSGAPQ